MELPRKNSSKELKSKLIKQNKKDSLKIESYLEIKSRNIFSKWIKRYFVLLKGKIIIYTESKENKLIKGYILVDKISDLKYLESNNFSIETKDENLILRAENNKIQSNWIKIIEKLKHSKIIVKKETLDDNNISKKSNILFEFFSIKKEKKNNLKSLGKKYVNLVRKNGYIIDEDDIISKSLLYKYGINKLINLNDPKILENIYYGFMYRRQKHNDKYDKKWFFLFSRNILFNKNKNKYNEYLEDKRQKEWLKFDTLYCLDYEKLTNIDDIFDEIIKMDECIKIIKLKEDEKYIIYLESGENIYNFYCEYKFERDEWFKALISSKNTAKIFKFSITKNPKNINHLYDKYLKNKTELLKEMKSEMNKLTGDIKQIKDFKTFEFIVDELKKYIISNIDGCSNSVPFKLDFLNYYIENANKQYINIYKVFWDKLNLDLPDEEIIQLGIMLLNYYAELKKFGVDDINVLKNGNYFIKTYFKIIFPNILTVILNSIQYIVRNKEGKYTSEGPYFIFNVFNDNLNKIKGIKYKQPFIYYLQIINMFIFQYCLGINCIISNRNINIEDEFLITISNDTLTLINNLNDFIGNVKKENIITEPEINEAIHLEKVNNIINKIGNHAIIHLIYKHKYELGGEIKEKSFLKMDIENIIKKSDIIYGKYGSVMNEPIRKKYYNEILKLILSYYILILLTKNKGNTKDIIEKIKKDKLILSNEFKHLIKENLLKETLKILDDIIASLENSAFLISTTIESIRKYIGPAFTYSVAEKLINLRNDLDKKSKKDYLSDCEKVLNTYKGPEGEKSTYFQILSKNQKITDSKFEFGSTILPTSQKFNDEPDEGNYSYDLEEEKNYNVDIDISGEQKCNEITYSQFFKDELEINEENEEEEESEIKEDFKEDIKPDYDGFFSEKSNIIYYFQIKNSCLYLFKEKTSQLPFDKFLIKNIDIINAVNDDNIFSFKNLNEKDKIHKFLLCTDIEKRNLIKAIKKASNSKNEIKEETKFPEIKIKERKRVILDKLILTDFIKSGYIENQMMDFLKSGKYFSLIKVENTKQKKKKPKYF